METSNNHNLVLNYTQNNKNNTNHNNTINILLSNFTFFFLILVLITYYISSYFKKNQPNPFIVATNEEVTQVDRCPICLKDLEENDNLRFKVCTHILCVECGNGLIRNHINKCPVCRRNIYERVIEV